MITVNIKYMYHSHNLSRTLAHLRALTHAHTHENSAYIYVYIYAYIYSDCFYTHARVMPEKSRNTP